MQVETSLEETAHVHQAAAAAAGRDDEIRLESLLLLLDLRLSYTCT
jgi:hypothetical protein